MWTQHWVPVSRGRMACQRRGTHAQRCCWTAAIAGALGLGLLAVVAGCSTGALPGDPHARLGATLLPDQRALAPGQAQQMYNWLVAQTYLDTGLVESFSQTTDPCLQQQASTYDQSIAGIMACLVGDCDRAKQLLDFFQARWTLHEKGFGNFYHTRNGRAGLEATIHAGPTLWIALLALQYEALTGSTRYRPLALEIARWTAALPHHRGGVAMGPGDEVEGTPWTQIVSTEHNLDYYAILRALEPRVATEVDRRWIRQKIEGVEGFMKSIVYNQATAQIHRGFRAGPGEADRVRALDTLTWALAAMGPATLRHWGMDPERLIEVAEHDFCGTIDGLDGCDFTDAVGAQQAGRQRMISLEWTGQMVNAYLLVARDLIQRFAVTREPLLQERAQAYQDRARRLLAALDQQAIQETAMTLTYPYASLPGARVFEDGWRTPPGRLGGSVAATAWRVFAGSFNPLQPGDWLSTSRLASVRRGEVHPHPRHADAALLPASTCTVTGLMGAAGKHLDVERYGEAIDYAKAAVQRRVRDDSPDTYAAVATHQQQAKAATECLILPRKGDETTKHRILAYAALNDVAAAHFIMGRAHVALRDQAQRQGDHAAAQRHEAQAQAAFKAVVDVFPCAQIWDPLGWFWAPAPVVRREYAALLGQPRPAPAVYTDKDAAENYFIPSGWMGDIEDIDVDDAEDMQPYKGRSCIRITYTAQGSRRNGWAGIYWQYPERNWGDNPEGYNLTGAQRLVWWARGQQGGEKAEFKVGGIRGRYPDSIRAARSTGVITLSREWQRYEFNVADLDLTHVIGGFVWVTSRGSNPRGSTIYLDEIHFAGPGLPGR